MNNATERYEEGLRAALANAEEAAAYLNAALEEGDQAVFLLALRDIAEARGFAQLAEASELGSVDRFCHCKCRSTGFARCSSDLATLPLVFGCLDNL